MRVVLSMLLYLGVLITPAISLASERADAADLAVANILFEYEDSNEYASYRVNDNGHVDIIFARNIPGDLYSKILTSLKNHPDISSVLAGTTGAFCPRFQ